MSLDPTPQARAARITYHLLLRQWSDLPGLTSTQVGAMLGLTWNGANTMMRVLSAGEALPIYRTDDQVWWARYAPYGMEPLGIPLLPTQKASVIAHRLVCRYLFLLEDGVTSGALARLVGMSRRGVRHVLNSMSETGGVPLYSDRQGNLYLWRLQMRHFDIVSVRKDSPM